MVTHQTASLMAAKPCGGSEVLARSSRSTVSCIAAMVQPSAPPSAGGSPTCWRFQATRQRAEQNRACSRRGANEAPHCSHSRVSVISLSEVYVTRNSPPSFPVFGALNGGSGWTPGTVVPDPGQENDPRGPSPAAAALYRTNCPAEGPGGRGRVEYPRSGAGRGCVQRGLGLA